MEAYIITQRITVGVKLDSVIRKSIGFTATSFVYNRTPHNSLSNVTLTLLIVVLDFA